MKFFLLFLVASGLLLIGCGPDTAAGEPTDYAGKHHVVIFEAFDAYGAETQANDFLASVNWELPNHCVRYMSAPCVLGIDHAVAEGIDGRSRHSVLVWYTGSKQPVS
jgi:hypothetical protein